MENNQILKNVVYTHTNEVKRFLTKKRKQIKVDHLFKEESPCYYHITTPISLVQQRITFAATEKAMASHSSTPAWKVPWTGEPGGLQSMGSLRVRHD